MTMSWWYTSGLGGVDLSGSLEPGAGRGVNGSFIRAARRLAAVVSALLLVVSFAAEAGNAGGNAGGSGSSGPDAIPAARQANNVAVITIEGPITWVTAHSVERRIRAAERSGANAIVLDINTPGGEVGAVLEICNTIKSSSITNRAAWINHDAISGGALIALAAGSIIVNDPARLGDAQVVTAFSFMEMFQEEAIEMRLKMQPPLLAEVLESVRRRNREAGAYEWDELLAQAIISPTIELWYVEHKETGERLAIDRVEFEALFPDRPLAQPLLATASPGSADATAPPARRDLPTREEARQRREAVERGEGDRGDFVPGSEEVQQVEDEVRDTLSMIGASPSKRPIIAREDAGEYRLLGKLTSGEGTVLFTAEELRFVGFADNPNPIRNDQDLKDWFGAQYVERLDQNWSETMAGVMTAGWIRGVLIVVFLLAFFIELITGAGIAGGIAVLALVALLAPPMLIGMASWWDIAAIVLGLGLIAVELFVLPGVGVFAVLGVVALFVGLLGTFIPNPDEGIFPDSPQGQRDMLYGIVTILVAMVTSGIGMWVISKHFGRVPVFRGLVLTERPAGETDNSEGMLAAMDPNPKAGQIGLGDTGEALTALRPVGRVEFNGQIVDALTEGDYIARGQTVRVVRTTQFNVVVEPVDTDSGTGTDGASAQSDPEASEPQDSPGTRPEHESGDPTDGERQA